MMKHLNIPCRGTSSPEVKSFPLTWRIKRGEAFTLPSAFLRALSTCIAILIKFDMTPPLIDQETLTKELAHHSARAMMS